MRRRALLVWTTVVLGLALLLPTSAMAGSKYTWAIQDNYCDGPTVHFTVTWWASGASNANKLTINSAVFRPRMGHWWLKYRFPEKTKTFPINGQTHSITVARTYSATHKPIKIGFTLEAWHHNSDGSDTILARRTPFSVVCNP